MYDSSTFYEFVLVRIEHEISQIISIRCNGDELATHHIVHNKLTPCHIGSGWPTMPMLKGGGDQGYMSCFLSWPNQYY